MDQSLNKVCSKCSKEYEYKKEDLEFFQQIGLSISGKKIKCPLSNDCPDCRSQNMLALRNERNLFKRKCDATGKDIISIHRPGDHVIVYDQDYWWGNNWDAKDYGVCYDFTKGFFGQFSELYKTVPQISLNAPFSEKSEYTNQCQGNKECYIMFCSGDNDNCYYGMWNQNCKYCVDCLYLEFSENCYELVNGKKCYSCLYSWNLDNCRDTYFSRDCIGCSNCVGCVNITNKSYYIFNEAYSKEEYFIKLEKLDLTNYIPRAKFSEKFKQFQSEYPVKYYSGKKNERFSGDYVESSKQSEYIFNCRDTEDSKYCRDAWRTLKCYDIVETLSLENSYMIEGSAFVTKCLFGMKLANCNNVHYSSHCNNSNNLFGCIGINNGSYCIFNKQYSKEEYHSLLQKIINKMISDGEWGQYFPASMSPFGYTQTVAEEYFHLEKQEALDNGFSWSDYQQEDSKPKKVIKASQLPDTIAKIPDDILNWAIVCESTGKLFRITRQELAFYRKHNIPIPKVHHNERHKTRMNSRNPRKLNSIKCKKCSKVVLSSFNESEDSIVYCEDCFNKSLD